MTKLDVNGNTVTTNRKYLMAVLRNTGLEGTEFDSAGRAMVPMADGGMIVFFLSDEPGLARKLGR